jgi:hypothetical protein
MKKLLFSLIAGIGLLSTANADSLIGGGLATNSVVLLSTNGGYVYSITISAPNTATVIFYDSDVTNAALGYGTNYTNAAFPYRASTNITYVTNYVDQKGNTNWFTNKGIYTYTATQAIATNVLPAMGAFIVAGGQSVSYNVDMLFRKGISVYINTNATVVVNRRQ